MENLAVKNLISTGLLDDKKIFTTNKQYKRFLKSHPHRFEFKPGGLWYAIGSSWFEWCVGEDFGGTGKYVYEIELDPKANIIFLSTPDDVFSFSEKYKRRDAFYNQLDNVLKKFSSVFIDWARVMEDYDGIEVNPYLYELRLTHNLTWYYGWDVPSGCIWRASAKKKINFLAEYNPRKKEFVIL